MSHTQVGTELHRSLRIAKDRVRNEVDRWCSVLRGDTRVTSGLQRAAKCGPKHIALSLGFNNGSKRRNRAARWHAAKSA